MDVGHAERPDLAELLDLSREVERVTGHILEDVESAAEEDLPAGVGDDRTVVDRVVERDVEVDAPNCRTLFDLQQVSSCLRNFSFALVFSAVISLTLTSSAGSLALAIPSIVPSGCGPDGTGGCRGR